jgi:hypothetical protein
MDTSSKTRRLSEKEIKQLKYNLRPGFIFGIFMIVVGFIVFLLSGIEDYDSQIIRLISGFIIILAFLLTYLINRKILMDLKYRMKLISLGTISKKECARDYEAGSGVGISLSGKEHAYHLSMKGYDKCSLIIDNVRHNVNKDFWDSVEEGEEIEIHKTKYTDRIIGFSKKND